MVHNLQHKGHKTHYCPTRNVRVSILWQLKEYIVRLNYYIQLMNFEMVDNITKRWNTYNNTGIVFDDVKEYLVI